MSARLLILAAAGGSAALLLAAFGFQHLGDMAPCKLCIWQRWPHGVAVLAGIGALVLPAAAWPVLGALSALTTSAIGAYHAGVERGWWPGPDSCSSTSIEGLSTDALLDQIMAAPLVRCDEVPWALFGLSMAGWNALVSLGLAALWIAALRRA